RSASASSVKSLEHNDLIGVYLSGNNPDYILRVVQMVPEDDLSANMFLELQAAGLSGLSTTDPKSVIGSGTSSEYPALYEAGSETAVGFIYDGDYDGVPWLFDPNDEDPNIPGSPSSGEDSGMGLSVSLVYKYNYSDQEGGTPSDNESRLFVETRGIYPGEIEKILLSNSALTMPSSILATCQPAVVSKSTLGAVDEASCEIASGTFNGLTRSPSLVYQSNEGLGVFLVPKAANLTALKTDSKISYEINFRKPQDLEGNVLTCGEIAGVVQECPAMPPLKGEIRVRIPDETVGGFANVRLASGDAAAQSQADVFLLDASKRIRISSDNVSLANEYALDLFCPGFENLKEGYFEPPFKTTSFLPRGSAPSFTIAAGSIPTGGGRDCTVRLIASGEDDLGNSIGSTIHSFDITLTGGFAGVGGVVDNSL
ncbi:MAG: hypothetical protein VXY89_14050, partial [SAR324 cluster bacterium]|nr:hypothetical protein [SAR324 cluster bacterium]